MKISKCCSLIALSIMLNACNLSTNEADQGRYRQSLDDPNGSGAPSNLALGFPNLGNTCFANSTLVLLLSSKQIIEILDNKLITISGQTKAEINARETFKNAFKNLQLARDNKDGDLAVKLHAYFDAFEQARKLVLGSELVGNKDKLRKDQGDPRDFLNDILLLLGYGHNPHVAFTYNIFSDDNYVKIYPNNEPIISIPMGNLLSTKAYEIKDIYAEWMKKEMVTGSNRVRNPNSGALVDSHRYQVIKDPPQASLFMVAMRYIYATPPTRLDIAVKPSLSLTIISKKEVVANLANEIKYPYDFRAMAIHQGSTLDCGHYYTYVHDIAKQRFLKFNDAQVTIVTIDEMMKDAVNGYLYHYEHKLGP